MDRDVQEDQPFTLIATIQEAEPAYAYCEHVVAFLAVDN